MGKKKKSIITLTVIIALLVALNLFNRFASSSGNFSDLYAAVETGLFKVTVNATGELTAEKSIDIYGPKFPTNNNRRGRHSSVHAMDVKILDIVPEGTIVREGDYIAQLDRTNYDNSLKDQAERVDEMETDLRMRLLDSAVVLTNLRDGIKNQIFSVEEARIYLEQSRYEPPSTIRKAEIDLDKAKRRLSQLKRQYTLREAQKKRDITNLRAYIEDQRNTLEDLNKYLAGFTINATSPGMVIYKRNRNGTKRKAGSTLNSYDMVIATLPDLSSMVSKTHVSEIDVNKVKDGQAVEIKVDALPEKGYKGTVVKIANIGEELPNSDTKMFEVLCRIDEYDSRLRPSMTTGNEIIIKSFSDAQYIPLECVHTESDGISFVYTKNGTKQVVVLGDSNDKFVMVTRGLADGTYIYRYTPEDPESFKLEGKNLISTAD